MKAKYKTKYQKHGIHTVNCNGKIVLEEVDVEEFAVKLTMSDIREPAMETFRGETERFLEQLEGMRGFEINMSDLIDSKNRIIWICGLPGGDKSVLVKQLVYKWANGELFKEFKVCITFECRELNYFVQNEGKKFEKHELLHEFIKTIFNFDIQNGEDTIIMIDGYDEILGFKETDSIISQILDFNKTKYPHAKIIITGRPHVENMLLKHGGNNMGGLQKVEIRGLKDEHIEKFINKCAFENDDIIAKINMAKDSSKTDLKLLYFPQMLQSFCCMVMLSEFKGGFKNAAELYCWSFLLLLRQHAEKDGSRDKKISQIFSEYSKELLQLSKICHEMLNKNTIIFEGNIDFGGEGNEFLEGLFVDVSDDFKTGKEVFHLILMEFFSAVYVCTIKNPTEIIKDILKNKLYDLLFLNCQLMSGLMYEGIIKEMFTNAAKLKETNCKQFFENVLKLVRECVEDNVGYESFNLSVDVIMCLMSNNVIDKQFVLSIINQLSFKNVRGSIIMSGGSISSPYLIKMMESLIRNFECDDFELKKAFENVRFKNFLVIELNELKYAKYVASCDKIELSGWGKVTTTVREIRKEIDEINELGECKGVDIGGCKLQDEEFDDDDVTKCSKLKYLDISYCKVNRNSFNNLCKWAIASSVEEFMLNDIQVEWWNVLLDAIMNAKEKNDGDLALKTLKIRWCPFMNDEIKEKVITLILIHNYSSFIIICKWFHISNHLLTSFTMKFKYF